MCVRSKLRELEPQFKQAEQSAVIGHLASAIAHEIRNSLNYINLTLDHLRTSLTDFKMMGIDCIELLRQPPNFQQPILRAGCKIKPTALYCLLRA